jgi:protein-disulfide isomerase
MAQQWGVKSTPTFVINGQGMVGGRPFETFKQIIDSMLAEQ